MPSLGGDFMYAGTEVLFASCVRFPHAARAEGAQDFAGTQTSTRCERHPDSISEEASVTHA